MSSTPTDKAPSNPDLHRRRPLTAASRAVAVANHRHALLAGAAPLLFALFKLLVLGAQQVAVDFLECFGNYRGLRILDFNQRDAARAHRVGRRGLVVLFDQCLDLAQLSG